MPPFLRRHPLGTVLVAVLLFVVLAVGTLPGILRGIPLGLDLRGGFEVLYRVEPIGGGSVTRDLLAQTQAVLERRINALGVSEPDLSVENPDRIRVKLAGVTDEKEARRILAAQAELTFREVVYDPQAGKLVPTDKVLLTGADLREGSARPELNPQTGEAEVAVAFKDPQKFEALTREYYGSLDRRIGIFFDNEMLSAPVVRAVIPNGQAVITGFKDLREAKDVATLLNAGALPVKLVEISSNVVSPTLGQAALRHGIEAGALAATFIAVFLTLFYRLPGLVAVLSLSVYLYLMFVVLWGVPVTLTLPGIAAFILGMGMAVDANILTDERIKEELRAGRPLKVAVRLGSQKSLRSILDAHVTTIIAALVLFFLGTGSVRGFALVLITSNVVNLLTNVALSRLILYLLVESPLLGKPHLFGVGEAKAHVA
ncbi:MAG: Protein-export membrane protein SecD [Brockia lithotrophica]|uniref:Protein translocase subunit SecD n=1 Tax=Brockia lithotrophica TaxID=933949 RepID=A0A2T5G778_9BACL|nr:protein translocase subunit SecD [Brockia lithotrophica]PTQ52022.1 MAG: Protein-export membrane protein SecD [Brockia lithotrophica]